MSQTAIPLYQQPIDVVCPRCEARAVVFPPRSDSSVSPAGCVGARLVCVQCTFVDTRPQRVCWCRGPADPYFNRPLWFRAEVGGRILWALNRDHLAMVENYVAGRLRPRMGLGKTWAARLPGWLKSVGNRAEILRAIKRMRATVTTTKTQVGVS